MGGGGYSQGQRNYGNPTMQGNSGGYGSPPGMQSYGNPPPGGAGGLPPGTMPNPNNASMGAAGRTGSDPQSAALDNFRNKYLKGGFDYENEQKRNGIEAEANYGFIPYANALQAQKTQQDNMTQFWDTSGEQKRLNTHGMGIADAGSRREDLALSLGQKNNERDYGRHVVEGDRQFGLDSELGRGALANDQYQGKTNRIQVDNNNLIQQEQNRIAQYEAQTGRTDVEGRQKLDSFANDTARMTAEGNREYQRGQLGFEDKRLGMDDSYRRDALGQEGAIARERMRSEEMNNRYSVFGRAKAPNMRAMRSFN
jgi:hypothetical protein